MHRFNSFSNVNTKNWNFFATHGGLYKSEKIEQAFWKVIKPQGVEKKGCVSLRLILKNKGGKQHCFWKRGNIRKGVCWNRWLRLPFILFIRVSRKFYLHLCFKLRYYIQNGANFYKNWLLFSKILWGIWTTSDSQRKVQKAELWWATFAQKLHSFS